MKKNLVFKLGLFCAALVLIATCFVSSAWAKYTQTVSAQDSARVAKFLVSTDVDGAALTDPTADIDIFKTAFKNILGDTDNDEVAPGENLIAPGSNGSFVINFDNASEVAVEYVVSADITNTANIPLYFKVGDGSWVLATSTNLTTELQGDSYIIAVGGANQNVTVQWAWPYDAAHASALGIPGYVQTDAADTALGVDGTAVYNIKLTCVATQVKPA